MTEGDIISKIWLVGVSLSVISLIIQIIVYIFIPNARRLDLKILTQMTVAIIINVVLEYIAIFYNLEGFPLNILMTFYCHTGSALTCWKFIFSKNLYDKVIQVFTEQISFKKTSLLVWILTLPVGIVLPILYSLNADYVVIFLNVYLIITFAVLTVNMLFFFRIFYVVLRRKMSTNNATSGLLRICIILFTLLFMSSLLVFFLVIGIYCRSWDIMKACFLIESYQVLAVMAIFIILVRGSPISNPRPPLQSFDSTNSSVTSDFL